MNDDDIQVETWHRHAGEDEVEVLGIIRHRPDGPLTPDEDKTDHEYELDAAYAFMDACCLTPTPDAAEQLLEVFLPCLRIMCERGYDPTGATWQEGGWRSQLVDIRKKFKRLWFHAWVKGVFVRDHPIDMINYLGFFVRLGMNGKPWGSWGEPENHD